MCVYLCLLSCPAISCSAISIVRHFYLRYFHRPIKIFLRTRSLVLRPQREISTAETFMKTWNYITCSQSIRQILRVWQRKLKCRKQSKIYGTYVCLWSERVAFTPDKLSLSAAVQALDDVFSYDSVQSVGALFPAAFDVEGVDQRSGLLEVDEAVEPIVADVLSSPLAVVDLGTGQQSQQPLQWRHQPSWCCCWCQFILASLQPTAESTSEVWNTVPPQVWFCHLAGELLNDREI